jgi:hypothetical protein
MKAEPMQTRYARQTVLKEIGQAGQQMLAGATAVVAGLGALERAGLAVDAVGGQTAGHDAGGELEAALWIELEGSAAVRSTVAARVRTCRIRGTTSSPKRLIECSTMS